MSMGKTRVKVTEENENQENEKPSAIIKVPVNLSIVVPIEVDINPDDVDKEPSEEAGCFIADPMSNQEAVQRAVDAVIQSRACTKAFDRLTSTGIRFREEFPEVEIYVSPFAGIVEETKL